LIDTLLSRIQGDVIMTRRNNMADQQVYQILNQKSRTGKQNKIKTTEGRRSLKRKKYIHCISSFTCVRR
jgi:hypothetical protein